MQSKISFELIDNFHLLFISRFYLDQARSLECQLYSFEALDFIGTKQHFIELLVKLHYCKERILLQNQRKR